MRVLICGGRQWHVKDITFIALDQAHEKFNITHVIEGGAQGADRLGRLWAMQHKIPYTTYEAEWDKYGNSAGYKRNVRMAEEGKPDMVIAFPGGRGTDMMKSIAKQRGIQVISII